MCLFRWWSSLDNVVSQLVSYFIKASLMSLSYLGDRLICLKKCFERCRDQHLLLLVFRERHPQHSPFTSQKGRKGTSEETC